jgi:hypothetical protein
MEIEMTEQMTVIIASDCTLGELQELVDRHRAPEDVELPGELRVEALHVHFIHEDVTSNFEVTFVGTEPELSELRREYIETSVVGLEGEELEQFVLDSIHLYPITRAE